MRWLALLLLTFLCLALTACETRTSLPEDLAKELQTPEGNEVAFACPKSVREDFGTEELFKWVAEAMSTPAQAGGGITPGPISLPDFSDLPPAPVSPDSLASLLPPDPGSGKPVSMYTLNLNSYVGSPGSGYWESEDQLDKMGRLCGLSTSLGELNISASGNDITIRQVYLEIDYYEITPGAREAFRRELKDDFGEKVEDVSVDVGDERQLLASSYESPSSGESTTYSLLMRRRNIIVRLWGWDGEGETDAVLEYAAQLDQNIEATAQQQSQ